MATTTERPQLVAAADWKQSAAVLRDHIAAMAEMIPNKPNLFAFVAAHSRAFEPAPLPAAVSRGEAKRCYENCLARAILGRDYLYVEGYAFAARIPIPFSHAWLVCKRTGVAVDPTWDVGTAYIGVAFKTEYLQREFKRVRTSSLIDNWKDRWPLLHMTPKQLGRVIHPGDFGLKLHELGKVADDGDDQG